MANIINDIKSFLSVPFNMYLVMFLAIVGMGIMFFVPESPSEYGFIEQMGGDNASLIIDFFYSPGCPYCKVQMGFNAQLAAEYPQIKFVYHDVSNPEDGELLDQMYLSHGFDTNPGVPATFINDKYVIGYDNAEGVGAKLKEIIKSELNLSPSEPSAPSSIEDMELQFPFIGKIKPADYSLPLLAIILGLIDGFNPCAMWVLVYLISIVLAMKDKSRLWLLVGSFVLTSGILYFLFMTAWLNAFLFIGYFRPVTILVGLVALGGGILSLKEFIKNPSGTLECKVVGAEERKKTMNSIQSLISAPLTWATIVGIIILAFTVNSIEFVCSAAIPAVFTQVLALSGLSGLEYYFYILLYTLFFMLDDLLIFGLAALAVSSDIGQKYAGYCHVIGGIIMLALGIMLLFFPNMLH
ncbi:MAG: glutaredoxin [Candidatus Micrarchaeota archaeon]